MTTELSMVKFLAIFKVMVLIKVMHVVQVGHDIREEEEMGTKIRQDSRGETKYFSPYI